MGSDQTGILSLVSLKIGYSAGNHKKILLPPLNAEAGRGELIAVIGRNGIGKSTLLRTLTGLQPSLGGEIYYNGKNIKEFIRMDLARTVGYISTEIVKVSNMSVYDLVSLGRFPHTNWAGRIDASNHEVIMDAIEKTGMLDFCSRYIYELSDGERQRAMIARILAQDTVVMIMDEPTAFLDVGSKYEILHLMNLLTRENGRTIIFSTHDLHMAISQSDKIWLILDDSLIEGAPEDLMIKGSFDHLFDSSHVKFNAEQRTFSFKSEGKGSIYLKGQGNLRKWTEMAVNRAGYSVSDVPSVPYIIIPEEKDEDWIIRTDREDLRCDSIYKLISYFSVI
jgi:iron complex transport system ATP-binding protein